MSGHVRSCGLHGVPCGMCSAPAQFREFYPNGKVATVHVSVQRQDRHTVVTRCWATPGPPPSTKKPEKEPPQRSISNTSVEKPPRPSVSTAAELTRRANSPSLRRSA